MGKAGRKNKYDTHVKPYLNQIQEWANTMTEAQICVRLGVGKSAFSEYKRTHSELLEAIKKGRQDLVSDLRSALIRRACGYLYTERKTIVEDDKVVRMETVEKFMPPDVAALNLALKNYDKDNWANDPQALALRKRELDLREKQIEENIW